MERTAAGLYSFLASYRYRVLIPAFELANRRLESTVITVGREPGTVERVREPLKGVDVAVFSKLFDATPIQPELMRITREEGARMIVDICDDFDHKYYAEQYRASVRAADAVSTSSAFLAGRIAEMTGRRATIIQDPCEFPRREARWSPRAPLEALWFGSSTNISGLDKAVPALARSGIPMRLVVVTRQDDSVTRWERDARPVLPPTIALEIREWSLPATEQALNECDIVVLAINRESRYYYSKGPNRMVEALWAGRFVVAHPLPAYEEFREWAWIGEDLAAGMAWALSHPDEIAQRVTAAQEHIAQRYAPAVVAGTWRTFLDDVRAGVLPPG